MDRHRSHRHHLQIPISWPQHARLGFQTTKKFSITFDYYAHGRLYSGEFQSPVAIPQNERIPIIYNPLDPQQNSRSFIPRTTPTRPPLIAIGIAGSVVLSLLWLAILRSCN